MPSHGFGSYDVKFVTSKYDKFPHWNRDVHFRLPIGKFILKAPRITEKIAVKAKFISWTLDGHIFTRGKPLVKLCRLMLTWWNKFRSSTENNNYPIIYCVSIAVVSRRCYKTGIVGEGCNKGTFEETCICKKDLCNGSTIVTASTSVMAALALMVGILTRM